MRNARLCTWVFASLALVGCAVEEPVAMEVQAATGGNSESVKCCKALFPPGPERGQCISQAAHGEGPCSLAALDAGVPDAAEPDAEVVLP